MPQSELSVRAAESDIVNIEAIALQCSLQSLAQAGHFMRAFKMAAGIRALKRAITNEMMDDLLDLQGSSLGFRTDKDKDGGYGKEVVKECAIEAALRGAYWVGNEFNIIAGRAYMTKEYFTRMVREFPGLTDLRQFPGVPAQRDGGALVPYSITWKLNGVADRIDRTVTKNDTGQEIDGRIPIRVNSGMGADAILGKAERKALAAVYRRLTGSDLTDGDADDAPQRKTIESITSQVNETSEKVTGLGEVYQAMQGFSSIGDVKAFAADIRDSRNLSSDDLIQLDVWINEHCERIRNSRGVGSNKPKGDAHEG